MKRDKTEQYHEDFSPDEETLLSRREYLIGLKKWSKAVIGGVLLSSAVGGCTTAWGNGGSSGWKNGNGGGWKNRSGGGGGNWVNRRI